MARGVLKLALAACGVALAAGAVAQEPVGPLGGRDNWLLAQNRLDLPARLARTLAPGQTEWRVAFDWGSDFGWRQDAPGETPATRYYLVDGEHRTLDVAWRRGLTARLDVDVRVPVLWRGAGSLDGLIDWYHGWSHLPDTGRPFFDSDRFRIEGRDEAGRPLRDDRQGTGLGNLELGARLGLGSPEARWRKAVEARAALPTGTGPFAGGGFGVAGQFLAERALGSRWSLGLGGGLTLETDTESRGFRYAPVRGHGFVAAEWNAWRRVHLLAETTAASRLITNVPHYAPLQWYLRLGARLRLDSGWAFEGGFSEGLLDQRTTTDVAFLFGVSRRL